MYTGTNTLECRAAPTICVALLLPSILLTSVGRSHEKVDHQF